MTIKRQKRKKPREDKWIRQETWPHEYAEHILAGKASMEDVPEHLRQLVATFLEIAKHADERLAVKHGATIAMMKSLQERRQALANVPLHLRERAEYHARQIFEQLRKKRQPS